MLEKLRERVLDSSVPDNGIVLSHNCLVKTICGCSFAGATNGNRGSERGTRVADMTCRGERCGMQALVDGE